MRKEKSSSTFQGRSTRQSTTQWKKSKRITGWSSLRKKFKWRQSRKRWKKFNTLQSKDKSFITLKIRRRKKRRTKASWSLDNREWTFVQMPSSEGSIIDFCTSTQRMPRTRIILLAMSKMEGIDSSPHPRPLKKNKGSETSVYRDNDYSSHLAFKVAKFSDWSFHEASKEVSILRWISSLISWFQNILSSTLPQSFRWIHLSILASLFCFNFSNHVTVRLFSTKLGFLNS